MSAYIISAMLALILAIVTKRFNPYTLLVGTFHVLALLSFFLDKLFSYTDGASITFLGFFCTGLILFGLLIRVNVYILYKIYTALFVCSILVFVVKPSLVITFITQTEMPEEVEFNLDDNLFLIKQDPLLKQSEGQHIYKVSKKLGSFHRTLARNIEFEKAFDSVQVITINDSIIKLNTFNKATMSKSNQNVLIDLTKLKKRDNANIQ